MMRNHHYCFDNNAYNAKLIAITFTVLLALFGIGILSIAYLRARAYQKLEDYDVLINVSIGAIRYIDCYQEVPLTTTRIMDAGCLSFDKDRGVVGYHGGTTDDIPIAKVLKVSLSIEDPYRYLESGKRNGPDNDKALMIVPKWDGIDQDVIRRANDFFYVYWRRLAKGDPINEPWMDPPCKDCRNSDLKRTGN